MSAILVCAAVGCSDPCADLPSPASITIGGADYAGEVYEDYASGSGRDLVVTQGGMLVWFQVRVRGLCRTDLVLERRVTDDTGALRDFGRGVPPLIETDDPDVLELRQATPLLLCPPTVGGSPVGHTMTIEVTATDTDGREVTEQVDFVPTCRPDERCEGFCGPEI